MSNFCIMRCKKLKTMAAICSTLAHHLRTEETPNAEPEKIKDNWYSNYDYPRTENGIDRSANLDINERKKMQERAIEQYKKELPQKVRKNAVLTLEFMMTVSPEVAQSPNFNMRKYMNACDQWAKDIFGKQNVYFVAHHMDETTPHSVVMVLPKDEKGKLNAKKYIDGKKKLSELQDDFAEKVGKQFGLERGVKWSRAKHQKIQKWYGALQKAIDEHQDIVTQIMKNIPEKDPSESEQHYKSMIQGVIAKELTPYIQATLNHANAEKRTRALNFTLEKKAEKLAYEKAKDTIDTLVEEVKQANNTVLALDDENNRLAEENKELHKDDEFVAIGKILARRYPQEAQKILEWERTKGQQQTQKRTQQKEDQEVER